MNNTQPPIINVIIEARMTSSRLPGKVLLEGYKKPMLEHLIERCKRSTLIKNIIIATTVNSTDDPIINLCENLKIKHFRGSEEDVLKRVLDSALMYNTDIIVEITGDCPLIDPGIIDDVISTYLANNYDYVSNTLERTFPRGLDVQVFSTQVLQTVDKLSNHPMDREHVSLYIYKHPKLFSCHGITAPIKDRYPGYRWTLDTYDDYIFIKKIFENIYPKNPNFSHQDVYKLVEAKPELIRINQTTKQKALKYYE